MHICVERNWFGIAVLGILHACSLLCTVHTVMQELCSHHVNVKSIPLATFYTLKSTYT